MASSTLLRIKTLIDHIDVVKSDLEGLTLQEFKKSDLLVRATCFSLSQIGEQMNKLQKALEPRYSKFPWKEANKMRTLIVHIYNKVKAEIVYNTVKNDLDSLKDSFLAAANDIETGCLTSDRLLLRKFKLDDAQEMFDNWASDPKVTKYVSWQTHQNVEVTKLVIKEWVEEYNNSPKTFRYAIALKSSGSLIGSIDVVNFHDDAPEIGYCLSRKYWNNGYMTEACKTLIKYLFDIGYKKIIIRAAEKNIASIRVIEKCGFTLIDKETRLFKSEEITINRYELLSH